MYAAQRVVENLPIIQQTTRKYPLLSQVLRYTVHGRPNGEFHANLKLLYYHQHQLTTDNDFLLCGMRLILRETFCQQVLELHQSHPGIVQIKSMARIYAGGQELTMILRP